MLFESARENSTRPNPGVIQYSAVQFSAVNGNSVPYTAVVKFIK